MKSKKIIPDIKPHNEFDNMLKVAQSFNDVDKQKVMSLIKDLGNEEDKIKQKPICYCVRCGRPIKNLNSVTHNMGPICYKHYCEEQKKAAKELF